MIVPNLISDSIPSLQWDDSGEHALMVMQEFNVSQLPVLDGKKYMGLVTMDEIINLKHLSQTLKSFQLPSRKPFAINTSHIFDVMRAALDSNVKVVPVVNEEFQYLGLISAESCLRAFAVMNSVKDAGAILELEVPVTDYSLAEIARIAEDNETNILCFYTNVNQENAAVQMTLKVNTTDVNGLVAAFERYEYEIRGVYNEVEYTEELKDRYDGLMRYLNI
jgi:signal-transduction protein with cAMP-binding, CBS, and nucleotidyltransferase domain